MPTRKKPTPNLVDDLLGGKPATEDSEPVSQQSSEPAKPQAGEPVSQEASSPPTEVEPSPSAVSTESSAQTVELIKGTYYHGLAAAQHLEDLRSGLRALVDPRRRSSINKSTIVDAAITIVFEDFKAHRAESQLAKSLLNQQDDKPVKK